MINNNPLVIGVSYNDKVGGSSSQALRNLIIKSGAILNDIDYRSIMPINDDLEKIYSDSQKAEQIFQQAKLQAKLALQDIDCLIIPGNGSEVDPRLFGGTLNPEEKDSIDLARAIAEMALAHVALESGMPILAICGGHQILNTLLGGTVQALSEDDLDEQGFLIYAPILFKFDSELARIINIPANEKGQIIGKFFGAHKQVVNKIGGEHLIPGNQVPVRKPTGTPIVNARGKAITLNDNLLQPVAVASDSIYHLEAAECKYGAPIYSLQFHPEVGVAGMYSSLLKKISYRPPTQEIAEANFNIFNAFHKAVKTFQLKKIVNKDILNKINKKPAEYKSLGHNTKNNSDKPMLTLISFFMEAKTTKANNGTDEKNNHLVRLSR